MCKNRTMKERCCICKVTFAVCLITSLALIIAGFLIPPMGVIDGSVLTAVGELILFPSLLYGFRAVELGLDVKFEKGDAALTIRKEDNEYQQ